MLRSVQFRALIGPRYSQLAFIPHDNGKLAAKHGDIAGIIGCID